MKDKNEHTKALFAIIAAVILGSGNSTLSKIALKEIPPFTFSFIRFIIATICIVPLLIHDRPKITLRVGKVFLISLLASANIILFAFGVRLTKASTAQMLHASIPFLIAVFSYVLLKEKMTRNKTTGLIMGFIGVGAIVLAPISGKITNGSSLSGNILILISAVCYALYAVLSKHFQKHYTPIFLMAVYSITTAIISFIFSINELTSSPYWWQSISRVTIFATIFTAVCGSFLFYLLFQYAIKHGTPVSASIILYLVPVAAFIWAHFMLGEQLTVYFVIGAVITFVGAYLVTKKTNTLIEFQPD